MLETSTISSKPTLNIKTQIKSVLQDINLQDKDKKSMLNIYMIHDYYAQHSKRINLSCQSNLKS